MGNAYVGLADDEQAVFLNPAGLAGIKDSTVHYLVEDIDASLDLGLMGLQGTSAFSDFSTDAMGDLLGKNLYVRSQFAPIFVMPNFGIGLMVDDQAAFLGKNKALPRVTVGYQMTNGVQMGFGTTVTGKRSRIGELRVGVGAKVMWRRGGYKQLSLAQLLGASRDTLAEIAPRYQMGKGLDLGVQFVRPLGKRATLSLGLAWTDVGDTTFGDGQPDTMKQNLSAGAAVRFNTGRSSAIIIAYDYKHINEQTDWRKRNHLGLELAFPILSLYGGINQNSLTYGFGMDLWIFRLTAISYAEELGMLSYQETDRRYMLRLALKFGL